MAPLDDPFRLGISGLADHHLRAQGAAERLAVAGQLRPAGPPPADRALAVPDQHPRHRPQPGDELPPAGEQVRGACGSGSAPRSASGSTHGTMVSTGSCAGLRTRPHPAGMVTGGNQKSHWAISPAAYAVRDAGSGGRYAGRSSATRSRSTRTECSHPIRSAITVAGIVGYAFSSSRIRGSAASVTDPFRRPLILRRPVTGDRRPHRVPRDPHHPGDHLDRHLLRPVQPADLSPVLHAKAPLPPPGSDEARVIGQGVKIQMPRRGQYSRAADSADGP